MAENEAMMEQLVDSRPDRPGENAGDPDQPLPIEDYPAQLDRHGPLFILGCPRSGTTFLSRCVGAMPAVDAVVGRIAPPRMMHVIGERMARGADVTQERLLMRDIFWQNFVRRRLFRDQRLADLWNRREGLAELFGPGTIEGWLFCYKEPFAGFAIDALIDEFPAAKFIHIVRDGRDNADSMVRSYPHALSDETLASRFLAMQKSSEIGPFEWRGGFAHPWWVNAKDRKHFRKMDKYLRNVLLWRELTGRVETALAARALKRSLRIRYEELVVEPVAHAKRLAEFVGQPVRPAFLRKLKKGHAHSVAIAAANQPADKIAAANRIAGDLLQQMGYPVGA